MIAYKERRIPISVTKYNEVPRNRGERSICPKCGEISWERVYVPFYFTMTKGLQVWRCASCRNKHLHFVETEINSYHLDFFGDVTSLASRIMRVAEDVPCPHCLGYNLSPMVDEDDVYLECDVCDTVIRGQAIPRFFDLHSLAYSLANEYIDKLTSKEHHYLMLCLYLYIIKYPDRHVAPSLITRVYPQIPVYTAAKLAPMVTNLISKNKQYLENL